MWLDYDESKLEIRNGSGIYIFISKKRQIVDDLKRRPFSNASHPCRLRATHFIALCLLSTFRDIFRCEALFNKKIGNSNAYLL